jgi:hypothetical protein
VNFVVGPYSLGVTCQSVLCLSHSDHSLTQILNLRCVLHLEEKKKLEQKPLVMLETSSCNCLTPRVGDNTQVERDTPFLTLLGRVLLTQ